jgi:hypothetical protein
MRTSCLFRLFIFGCIISLCSAEDITTLDGQKYEDVRDVTLKHNGLFFVSGSGDTMKGVTVRFSNLPDDLKQKYHYDSYEAGMLFARQNQIVYLSKNLAFSLDSLEAAKKKARAEKKLLGFIMVWGTHVGPRPTPGLRRQRQRPRPLLRCVSHDSPRAGLRPARE